MWKIYRAARRFLDWRQSVADGNPPKNDLFSDGRKLPKGDATIGPSSRPHRRGIVSVLNMSKLNTGMRVSDKPFVTDYPPE
jgi:hypothetical protein